MAWLHTGYERPPADMTPAWALHVRHGGFEARGLLDSFFQLIS